MATTLAPETAAAFQGVADVFAHDKEVSSSRSGSRFGDRNTLKVRGKIFAMISSKGEFVVKLPATRVFELVRTGTGEAFAPGHGRIMKQWLVVKAGHRYWRQLAIEARTFAD